MTASAWQDFLRTQGVSPEAAGEPRTPAAGARLFDLSHLACLWVEGPDAAKFLQGQVTCDMDQVTPSQSRRGAICNIQGRMICSFRVVRRQGDTPAFALIMHHALLDNVKQTLGKYIVFSKAELRVDANDVMLGFDGVEPAALASHFGALPDRPLAVIQNARGLLLRVDERRLLALTPVTEAKELWQTCADHAEAAGAEQWTLADVRASLAAVEAGTASELLPQMIALHVDEGVSFKKGCYIGQEVVARMHYRGKLKKHLYRARAKGAPLPAAGAPLHTEGQSQSIGTVVQSAWSDSESFELLAVVNDASVEKDAVYLDADGKNKLEFLPLS